ncbi:unnamed protein product [Paramecium sonneborni]|uniref:Uncharacterized protein n=1 Tax=Paramecium sonneborni TaxID=65129 RepID=A0A8S1RD99_9CILI|nr:unnamed protein product [Paramecium sonneborni]
MKKTGVARPQTSRKVYQRDWEPMIIDIVHLKQSFQNIKTQILFQKEETLLGAIQMNRIQYSEESVN